MKRYPKYKDSGVEWLGKIPEHWEVNNIRGVTKAAIQRNCPHLPLLAVYRDYGIILRDSRDDNHNRIPEDLSNYKVVKPGNLVLNKMKTWQGSLGVSEYEGIVSPAYIVCRISQGINSKFLHYLLRSYRYIFIYNKISYGIRVDQWDMRYEDFKQIPIFLPPLSEQKQIAGFLDRKLEQINHFISNKQRLIELLKEQKTAIINGAVTKGLNPHAPMKPSDIEWLEEIPEHWGVKRAKYYFYEVDERSESGTEELLSVSHITGVTPRSEKNITMFQAESYEGYKTCQVGDLVSNIMWAWMGALGVSNYSGIVSSSYGVYRQKNHDNFVSRYLDYLVRTNSYISEFICRSKGIRSSRLRMYTDDFFDIPIIKPPKEDQEKILNYIDAERVKINLAIAKIEKEIELIQEYRTTLISDAVTGKIDIRDTSIIETTLTTTAN